MSGLADLILTAAVVGLVAAVFVSSALVLVGVQATRLFRR